MIYESTQNCYENFGIPKSLLGGYEQQIEGFTIDDIIPSIRNPDKFDDLKNEHGIIC